MPNGTCNMPDEQEISKGILPTQIPPIFMAN